MLKKPRLWLVLILLLAAFLRLYRFDLPDVLTDEVFYGFRSIGLVDSLYSPYQPTPFEWFDPVPWWAHISFHDHPPLGFWIEHSFFKVFGVNLFALRLPFILAGVLAVLLLYLVARRLFANETVALLGAGILSVNTYHIWISRLGLQESLVIFFILLAVWFFLKAVTPASSPPYQGGEREGVYFYLTVISIGLAILMKYTAVVLLPIFFVYLLLYRRDLLTLRRLALGGLLLLAIISPIIIYNINLYQARGHFDFQISYLLGQNVPEWAVRPGREAPGGLSDRAANLFVWLTQGYGIVFSAALALSLPVFFAGIKKNRGLQFLSLAMFFLILLLFAIGTENRFVPMTAPFFALVIAYGFYTLTGPAGRVKKVAVSLAALFLAWEVFYAVNTNHTAAPKGREVFAYSRLRRDAEAWGYNQLETKFLQMTDGLYPSGSFTMRFPFAKKLRDAGIARAKAQGKKSAAVLFIIDSRLHGPAQLWYVTRHQVYEGWPMIDDFDYLKTVAADPQFFVEEGFTDYVFIRAENTLLRPDSSPESSNQMVSILEADGVEPVRIESPKNQAAFWLYHFSN